MATKNTFIEINKSKIIVEKFFENDKSRVAYFMQLVKFANAIDKDIAVRCNDSIIGASKIDSVYYFYVSVLNGEYSIKFKHLNFKITFDEENISISELKKHCKEAIEYVDSEYNEKRGLSDESKIDRADINNFKIKETKRTNKEENYQYTKRLISMLSSKYGFSGFYHYTDFENLGKILDYRYLICRSMNKSHFIDAADQDALIRAPKWIFDQVRLFYFPLTPFLCSPGVQSSHR